MHARRARLVRTARGVSKDIRARILNHVEGARSVTDAVYNQHEFWAEKRVAPQRWEAELRRIIGS